LFRALLLFVPALCFACSGTADLGGGPFFDGGRSPDGGDAPVDAGQGGHDGGAPVDAGTEVDASPLPEDAGSSDPGAPDAGSGDPAPSDAGSSGPPDSGPPPVTGPWIIHVAPNGNDSRDGSTPAQAVRTLNRVHQLIADARPNRDVEVRIAPGTYRGQQVRWTYTMPDHSIRFVTAAVDRTRPVFDGCLAN